ncbi:MAG TPA: PQQ-dependent sugar dehydrogenase, partial [Gaiellales bacterium]|nr:PQQ-dependent sugar dehydrogenase [Gaiellales bacterium]
MRKPVAALLLGVALAAPSQAHALTRGTHVEVFKRGLNQVVDMAYVPRSTKLFYTEKNTGAIRVIVAHRLLPTPCVTLDVVSDGERGALGLVLDPDYRTNHYLYVYFTKRSPLENRVTRFTVKNNRCTHAHPLITGIRSAAGYHNGGQLFFVGNKLFVTVGDNHDPANAQNLHTRLGKVLRYNRDGSIPRTNPILGGRRTAIWSYGHRNGFGLTAKPNTKRLYETENGPSCDDELNHIMKG